MLWLFPDDGEESLVGSEGGVEIGGALDGAVALLYGDDLCVVFLSEVAFTKRLADRVDWYEELVEVGVGGGDGHGDLIELEGVADGAESGVFGEGGFV